MCKIHTTTNVHRDTEKLEILMKNFYTVAHHMYSYVNEKTLELTVAESGVLKTQIHVVVTRRKSVIQNSQDKIHRADNIYCSQNNRNNT